MTRVSIDADSILRLSRDLLDVADALRVRAVPEADAFAFGPGTSGDRLTALLRDWEHHRLAVIDEVTSLSRVAAVAAEAYAVAEGSAIARFTSAAGASVAPPPVAPPSAAG